MDQFTWPRVGLGLGSGLAIEAHVLGPHGEVLIGHHVLEPIWLGSVHRIAPPLRHLPVKMPMTGGGAGL